MKKFLCCLWILGISGGLRSISAVDDVSDSAVGAAQSWLALVDSGKYGESWDEAAQILKSQITKDQWVKKLNADRFPLGKLQSRTLKSTVFYTKSLPGVPEAEFVIIQFDTTFERSKSFVEMITPTKEKDGQWRTSGYVIDIWRNMSRALTRST